MNPHRNKNGQKPLKPESKGKEKSKKKTINNIIKKQNQKNQAET